MVNQFQKTFGEEKNVIVHQGNFGDFLSYNPYGLAVICPVDSFGNCSTGLAKICNERFPGLEGRIKQLINNHGEISNKSRAFLELGSAACVLIDKEMSTNIIAVSTMYTDQTVANTQNAFYAFLGAKNVAQKINRKFPHAIQTVICPGLCTGTGNMPVKKAVEQIYMAFNSSQISDARVNITNFYHNSDAYNNPQPLLQKNKEFIILSPPVRRRRIEDDDDSTLHY